MANKLKWNDEAIVKYIQDANYDFICFIDEYNGKKYNKIGARRRLRIKCKNHNHEAYDVTFRKFLEGNRCNKCKIENEKLNFDYIKEYIESFNYKLLSTKEEYTNNHSNILIQCDKQHEPYYVSFSNFKNNNSRCPHCCYNKKFSYNEVKNYIESFNYRLLSNEYNGTHDYLLVQCNNFHKPYKVTFNNFKKGNRCPHCNIISKGELKIEEILTNKNILFEKQKTFNDCKSIRKLPFDFYIIEKNILVEYDGEFHYQISRYDNGFDKFVGMKIRDTIKTKYCKDNNIKLIRIPYWEYDNIENILIKELNLE